VDRCSDNAPRLETGDFASSAVMAVWRAHTRSWIRRGLVLSTTSPSRCSARWQSSGHGDQNLFQQRLNAFPRHGMLDGAQDHGCSVPVTLLPINNSFVKLLGRTQAGIGNLDVSFRVLFIAYGQTMRLIMRRAGRDAHRFAHVENEHVAASPWNPPESRAARPRESS